MNGYILAAAVAMMTISSGCSRCGMDAGVRAGNIEGAASREGSSLTVMIYNETDQELVVRVNSVRGILYGEGGVVEEVSLPRFNFGLESYFIIPPLKMDPVGANFVQFDAISNLGKVNRVELEMVERSGGRITLSLRL